MRRLIQDSFEEPNDFAALRGEPLVIHQRLTHTRNRALIIFVHGLGGSRYGPRATWGCLPRYVFEDFPDVDVGLYDYVTLFRRLKFWESIELSREAIVFADQIRDVVPYQLLILVGHSMGGLLCQAAIGSLINTRQEQILQKIGGMILMASPQTGSQRVPGFLSLFSKDAYALRPHGEFVTSLQRTLTDWLWLIESGSPPPQRYHVPTWAILGSSDFWVDQLSANIGVPSAQTKTIRGSHTQIVKPDSKQHDGYEFLCQCIDKLLTRFSPSTEGQRRAEERNLAVRIPPSRIPAVGIFLDRKEILARLTEFLNDKTRKLMVIAGLPGMGKSALAAKTAQVNAPQFKDTFWITCSRENSTVDQLLGQFHSFLERNGDESLRGLWNASLPDLLPVKIDALVEALSRSAYLLIFDDFGSWLDEQLGVKNADLRRILHAFASSDHVSKILLITQRKPFFDPQSSPIPPGTMQNEELFGLEEAEAINLLKQYLPHENDDLLRRISQACGANPRMLNWFGYLVAAGRQEAKTLLASEGVELSWKLLSGALEDLKEESRQALELLCVFRRPLTKEHLDRLRVPFQKAVLPLIDRFLVSLGQPDNSVLLDEPAKTFVRSKLGPERLRQLHLEAAGFYAANQSSQPFTFRDALPIIERAYHLAEIGQGAESADAILGISQALTDWGYLDLLRNEIGRVSEMINADQLRKARCLWVLAEINDVRSEYPAALNMFQMSLEAFEAVQNYEGVARCRWRLGRVRNALGDFRGALEDFRVCIEICDRGQTIGPKAAALLDQGWTLAQQGARDQALAVIENSLELSTKSEDFQTEAGANRQIGWILWDYRREREKSQQYYQRSLEIGTNHGLLKELGAVHGDLGFLFTQWGDIRAAEDSCRAAIKIREALGDQHGLASAYLNLGLVFRGKQENAEEIRCYNESLAIYRRLKVPSGEAEVLLRLGIALRERTQLGESENSLKEALAVVQRHELKLSLGEVLHQMGKTLLVVGRNEEARKCLAEAVKAADSVKSPRATEYAQLFNDISSHEQVP